MGSPPKRDHGRWVQVDKDTWVRYGLTNGQVDTSKKYETWNDPNPNPFGSDPKPGPFDPGYIPPPASKTPAKTTSGGGGGGGGGVDGGVSSHQYHVVDKYKSNPSDRFYRYVLEDENGNRFTTQDPAYYGISPESTPGRTVRTTSSPAGPSAAPGASPTPPTVPHPSQPGAKVFKGADGSTTVINPDGTWTVYGPNGSVLRSGRNGATGSGSNGQPPLDPTQYWPDGTPRLNASSAPPGTPQSGTDKPPVVSSSNPVPGASPGSSSGSSGSVGSSVPVPTDPHDVSANFTSPAHVHPADEYGGGAKVVKTIYGSHGERIDITSTGAVIETAPNGKTPNRIGWVDPTKADDISTVQGVQSNLQDTQVKKAGADAPSSPTSSDPVHMPVAPVGTMPTTGSRPVDDHPYPTFPGQERKWDTAFNKDDPALKGVAAHGTVLATSASPDPNYMLVQSSDGHYYRVNKQTGVSTDAGTWGDSQGGGESVAGVGAGVAPKPYGDIEIVPPGGTPHTDNPPTPPVSPPGTVTPAPDTPTTPPAAPPATPPTSPTPTPNSPVPPPGTVTTVPEHDPKPTPTMAMNLSGGDTWQRGLDPGIKAAMDWERDRPRPTNPSGGGLGDVVSMQQPTESHNEAPPVAPSVTAPNLPTTTPPPPPPPSDIVASFNPHGLAEF